MQHAPRTTALALGIAGALAFGSVHASGFQLKENSVKGMGQAFAGIGLDATDGSNVVNNPGTLSRVDGTLVQSDLSLIDLNFEFNGGGQDLLGQPLRGGDGGAAGDLAAVPALSLVHKFDNGLAVGAMVSAPFGLKTEYDRDWVGRYSGVESDVKVINLTLSAGLDVIPDRLSVGGGIVLSRADVTLSRAVDFGAALFGNPATRPLPFARPQASDGFAEVSGDDNGMGYVLGVTLTPTDRLSLGLSYQSEIDYDLEGGADWTVPGNVRAVFDASPATRVLFNDGNVTAKLTTPSTTMATAKYRFSDAFNLALTYAETGWESVQEVRIDFVNPDADSVEEFDWDTTRFMSIGGEWAFSDAWTFRAGYAYDETPTTFRTRTPRLPDEDRRWYSIGATWNFSEQLEFNLAYTRIVPDRPQVGIITPAAAGGQRLFGSYDSAVNLFGVSGQYRF